MTRVAIFALLLGAGVFALRAGNAPSAPVSAPRIPVLVELFTSEGCSDCPPADALLEKIDREQPVSGAEAIVLSEHVDYWDHQGWADPYSSALFTQRQEQYGDHFNLNSVYTPQMIVNGSTEFVGSDAREAGAAIGKAAQEQPVVVEISGVTVSPAKLQFHVHSAPPAGSAEVFAVLALESASSDVRGGENSGRKLAYVAVARTMTSIGKTSAGQKFDKDVTLPLNAGLGSHQLRLIAFLQEKASKRILGAAMQPVTTH